MKFLSILFLLPTVFAAPFGANHWPQPYGGNNAQAAYFLDNNPSGSSVVAVRVNSNGTLSAPVRTSTNGFGVIGVNGKGFPNAADPLFSQGAVAVSGNVSCSVFDHYDEAT